MKKSKKKSLHVVQHDNLARQEYNNNCKSLSFHDLKAIKPLTTPQKQMMESYFSGNSIFASGSAGTGKSLVALYLALNDLLDRDQPIEHVKIIRSVVPTREVGYLPGSIDEKISVYETPYRELFSFLFDMPTSYDKFKESGKVEFMPTSFLRGQTWDNSVIVVDEVQNLNFHEVNTVMTRVGRNSKIILVGDSNQSDLFKSNRDISCIERLDKVLSNNNFFDTIYFQRQDIVRSDFVRAWIECIED